MASRSPCPNPTGKGPFVPKSRPSDKVKVRLKTSPTIIQVHRMNPLHANPETDEGPGMGHRRRRPLRLPKRRSSVGDDGRGFTLDQATSGAAIRIVRVGGGRRLIHRLAALGIVPGATVTVTRPRGPAIVAVGGATVAIGREAARVIEIEEFDE